MLRGVLLLAAGSVAIFLPKTTAQGEDPKPVVSRILADWKARQERIRSIQVEISGTQFHPKGRWDTEYSTDGLSGRAEKETLAKMGHIPPEDTRHPLTLKLLLGLDQSWARKELQWYQMHSPSGQFAPKHRTHVYNGERIKVYEPRGKNTSSGYTPSKTQPDLWIQTDGFTSAFFASEDTPVFWGCGIVRPSALDPKMLRFPLEERNYFFKGYGDIGGRRCVVLRTPTLLAGVDARYEYWVDLASDRQSAIVRSQLVVEGHVDRQIDAEWGQLDGTWFPVKWRLTHWRGPYHGSTLETYFDLQVDRVVWNPSVEAADFDVALKPNMVVYDVGKKSHGVIGDDGHSLLPLSELDKPSRWRIVRIGLLYAGAAAVVLGFGWLLLRRWVMRATR